jgi:AraC-like DNA-binding protein
MQRRSKHPETPSRRAEPAFFSASVATARRFYLELNPSQNQPLTVVCGGLEHCTFDYAVHRETFPFYSIEYVARGRGKLQLGKERHDLESGAIFSYGPGTSHDIVGDGQFPLVKYFVDFSGRDAVALLNSCKLSPGSTARVHPAHALAALFEELIQSGLNPGRRNAKLCAKLLECLALKITGATTPLKGAETLAFSTYQHCCRHIERHFLRLRTLEQIASECHTNNAYLCRLFRRYDQQTPYQYLLRLKMNHAAERLHAPGMLVKQVAAETAFPDPFHFSRVFKTLFGVSPDSFRRLR